MIKGLHLLLAGSFAISFVSCTAPWSDNEKVDIKDPTVDQMETYDHDHGIDTHPKPRGTVDTSTTVTTPAPAPTPAPASAPQPAVQPAPLPGDGVSPSTLQMLKN